MKRKLAVYPGSFDPVTFGHLDILQRGLELFDKVIIAIAYNIEKKGLFTFEERKELIQQSIDGNSHVIIDSFDGLLIDYVKKVGATFVIRGLRAMSDFEYEFQIAQMNSSIGHDIETMFMMTSVQYGYLSSSIVKEVCALGGTIDGFVPPEVKEALRIKYGLSEPGC